MFHNDYGFGRGNMFGGEVIGQMQQGNPYLYGYPVSYGNFGYGQMPYYGIGQHNSSFGHGVGNTPHAQNVIGSQHNPFAWNVFGNAIHGMTNHPMHTLYGWGNAQNVSINPFAQNVGINPFAQGFGVNPFTQGLGINTIFGIQNPYNWTSQINPFWGQQQSFAR